MCKVLIVTNAKGLKIKQASRSIARIMESTGYQKDGFGYAVKGKNGVYGERGLKPSEFKSRMGLEIPDIHWNKKVQNTFGEHSNTDGAAIFHGRTSTNEVSLLNTHPIVKHGWTLIHNGVVTDHGPKYDMLTSNDSEHVLERLATGGIKAVTEHLTGYYAVAAFDPDGNLHVFKDSTAQLYSGYVKKLNSFVFGTSLSILEEFEKTLKLGRSIFEPVRDNVYMVFNQKGEQIHFEEISPRGFERSESKWAQSSLGYELDEKSFSESGRWRDEPLGSYDIKELDADELFWHHVDIADASYTFFDAYGNGITFDQFDKLDDDQKVYCTIVTGDGTKIMHPDESDNFSDGNSVVNL